MKTNQIPDRLDAVRKFMEKKELDAFIVPSTDPHMSEYPPKRWESRKWITNFTGSAGSAVITADKAGLWTDSRYFLQAATQLDGTGFDLFKMGVAGTPEITEWILSQVDNGGRVGIDGSVFTASEAKLLKKKLKLNGIKLVTKHDPFKSAWKVRPEIPTNNAFLLPVEIAGESVKSKISRVNGELKKMNADGLIIGTLDAVAWTFNIRGNDVEYNPVTVAYGYISEKESILFINPAKLTPEVIKGLKDEGVKVLDYGYIFEYISKLSPKSTVWVTGNKINYTLLEAVSSVCNVMDAPSPVDKMKSVKNETELKGFRNAMVKDGVALTRFYMWMENALEEGNLNELNIAEKLRGFRSQQDLYVGESFGTIAGYGGHGAIVHYSATEDSNSTIEKSGLLLIDSGAQFKDGTTDITRTWAVGETTEQMRIDYTNVLKGHIAIATAIFPEGTRGSQLDVLARKALWDRCETYWHGTGHGIGHFLNVHEGPQNIRLEENPTTLQPGMVTSNEPGLYRADQYGIRTENLIITQKYKETTDFGSFLNFETITLCPIDTAPIEKDMLTDSEKEWLNSYHARVYDSLQGYLSDDEKGWLAEKTKAI